MSDLAGLEGIFPPRLQVNALSGAIGVVQYDSAANERIADEIEPGSSASKFAMDNPTREVGYGKIAATTVFHRPRRRLQRFTCALPYQCVPPCPLALVRIASAGRYRRWLLKWSMSTEGSPGSTQHSCVGTARLKLISGIQASRGNVAV